MNNNEPTFEAFHHDTGKHRAGRSFDRYWGSTPGIPDPEKVCDSSTFTKLDEARLVLESFKYQREQREADEQKDMQ